MLVGRVDGSGAVVDDARWVEHDGDDEPQVGRGRADVEHPGGASTALSVVAVTVTASAGQVTKAAQLTVTP